MASLPTSCRCSCSRAWSPGARTPPHDKKAYLYSHFPESPSQTIESSYEAFQIEDALDFILGYEPKKEGMTLEDFIELYRLSVRGTKLEKSAGFRKTDITAFCNSVSRIVYIPPTVDRIDDLLQDLILFSNSRSLPALTRSCITHFQLEAISPVTAARDRLGRLHALLIWKQNNLIRYVIPPFSITPAIQTGKHTRLLMPYLTAQDFRSVNAESALEAWTVHSLRASNRSVTVANSYIDLITEYVRKWEGLCSAFDKRSALFKLIRILPGSPVISVDYASALIDRKYKATSQAVERLVELGILVALTPGKRNRLFVAQGLVERLLEIDHQLMPNAPVSRETFYTVV